MLNFLHKRIIKRGYWRGRVWLDGRVVAKVESVLVDMYSWFEVSVRIWIRWQGRQTQR